MACYRQSSITNVEGRINKEMNMILVTGAGGTVGSEVVRQLKKTDAPFRAGHHSAEKVVRAKVDGIDAVAIDFAKPDSLRSSLEGVNKLFLLSPSTIEGEENAIRAAKEAGVEQIVKLSVFGAQGEAFSFAKLHRRIEKEIESSGLRYTFLRPNGFMQNVSTFYGSTIKTDGAFYLPSKGARISHVDVRDVATVAVKALTEPGHDGKAYELTGPEALSFGEIAEKLSKATGRKIAFVDISDADFQKAMLGMGTPAEYVDGLLDLMHFYANDGASALSSAVRDLTGKAPRSFDDYARDHIEAFR